MNAPDVLTSNAMLILTISPFNSPIFLLRVLRKGRLAAQTRENRLVSGREIIEDLEFLETEPTRHDKNTQRNQKNNQDREANGCESMRDSNAGTDADELETDEKDNFAFPDTKKWVITLEKTLFGLEIDELLEDAIGFDRTPLRRRLVTVRLHEAIYSTAQRFLDDGRRNLLQQQRTRLQREQLALCAKPQEGDQSLFLSIPNP
jgi:hypothetical protein